MSRIVRVQSDITAVGTACNGSLAMWQTFMPLSLCPPPSFSDVLPMASIIFLLLWDPLELHAFPMVTVSHEVVNMLLSAQGTFLTLFSHAGIGTDGSQAA